MTGFENFWTQGDAITRSVAALLLAMSISAWVVIFWKGWLLRRVRIDLQRAVPAFWAAPTLENGREQLAAFRIEPASRLRTYPNGRLARASGLVTHRQRPETAKGTVFVTLEPCPMCAGALVNARVARVVSEGTPPTAEGGDYAPAIRSEAMWRSLAARPGTEHLARSEVVKVIVDRSDGEVYFMESKRWPIHFFFARGDEPGRTFRFIDHPRFGFSPNEIDYLRQDRRSGIEQLGMGLGAARVPIAIGFPTIFSWAENVAFTR